MDGNLFFDVMFALGGLGSVLWLAFGAWLSLGRDAVDLDIANFPKPRLGKGLPETQF